MFFRIAILKTLFWTKDWNEVIALQFLGSIMCKTIAEEATFLIFVFFGLLFLRFLASI